MRQPFRFLFKDRPKVRVRVTRDSVCAGDDGEAPHERNLEIPRFTDPQALAEQLSASYLPTVAGVGHTWDCMLNGNLVGTLSHTGFLPSVHELAYADQNHVHFIYRSATY
jgi:hypothetical protein